jgi:hypothetical protein
VKSEGDEGSAAVADEEDWEPSVLDWLVTGFDEGGVRGAPLIYIGALARAQEVAWEAAEEEIALAIFRFRYQDPPELWGELTERERGLSWEELGREALLANRETVRKRFRDRVEAIRKRREAERDRAQQAYYEELEERESGGGE